MTGALSGHFAVLAAHDADEAARLSAHFGPCQLAYLSLDADDDPATRLQDLDGLAPRVIALLRGPCPDEADKAGCPHDPKKGVWRLPLSPGALLAHTRQALGLDEPEQASRRPSSGVLTPEEVAFLMGRPLSDAHAGPGFAAHG